jgi:hypothetical protein
MSIFAEGAVKPFFSLGRKGAADIDLNTFSWVSRSVGRGWGGVIPGAKFWAESLFALLRKSIKNSVDMQKKCAAHFFCSGRRKWIYCINISILSSFFELAW